MAPYFSVIIPARNAVSTLPICLDSLAAMQKPIGLYEVLVVDDGSTDNTAECAAARGATVITRRCDCVAAVRNVGAVAAKGTILAFLDSDMRVDPQWLLHAETNYFGRGWKGVLSYADHAPSSSGWIGALWNDPDRRAARQGSEAHFMPTRNLLVAAEVHRHHGGFDERLFAGHRTGEDKEYTWRLREKGVALFCDRSLDMVHLGWERSLSELLKKERWRQGATVLMAARHGWNPRLLRTPVFAAAHMVALAAVGMGAVVWVLHGTAGKGIVTAGVVAWLAPSFIVSLRDSAGRLPLVKLIAVWFVSWLRWNAAASTLPGQMAVLARTMRGAS